MRPLKVPGGEAHADRTVGEGNAQVDTRLGRGQRARRRGGRRRSRLEHQCAPLTFRDAGNPAPLAPLGALGGALLHAQVVDCNGITLVARAGLHSDDVANRQGALENDFDAPRGGAGHFATELTRRAEGAVMDDLVEAGLVLEHTDPFAAHGARECLAGLTAGLQKFLARGIQPESVGRDDTVDVVRTSHSPLDLQAADSQLPQTGQLIQAVEIAGREEEAVAVIGEVAPPAGLFAFAAIAAPSPHPR